MTSTYSIRIRVAILLALALLLGTVTYAFANANTVPDSMAGDGSGLVSGYTAAGIHYALNATNPANIDSVSFTLGGGPAPTNVTIQLSGAGNWYTCNLSGGTWSCPAAGVTVASITNLRIVAAQ